MLPATGDPNAGYSKPGLSPDMGTNCEQTHRDSCTDASTLHSSLLACGAPPLDSTHSPREWLAPFTAARCNSSLACGAPPPGTTHAVAVVWRHSSLLACGVPPVEHALGDAGRHVRLTKHALQPTKRVLAQRPAPPAAAAARVKVPSRKQSRTAGREENMCERCWQHSRVVQSFKWGGAEPRACEDTCSARRPHNPHAAT